MLSTPKLWSPSMELWKKIYWKMKRLKQDGYGTHIDSTVEFRNGVRKNGVGQSESVAQECKKNLIYINENIVELLIKKLFDSIFQ